MESIVATFVSLLTQPESQPLLENLKKQNDKFSLSESASLLMEEEGSNDDEDVKYDEELDDEERLKQLEIGVLKKIAKLFEYTTSIDKFILFIGFIFTIIHAACFPIMAILFGKISNAFIAHKLLEMNNSTSNVSNANVNVERTPTPIDIIPLGFIGEFMSKIDPVMSSSVLTGNFSSGVHFEKVSPYESKGTEKLDDFASYVEDFSIYYVYIGLTVFVSSLFQTLCWEWVAENQLYRLRQKFIFQLLRQEQSWFRKHTAGSLVLKIADDCERFREGVGHNFSMVIECIAIAIIGAGIGLITSFKLTIVFLGAGPFILTKLIIIWKKITEKTIILQKEYAKAAKICAEVLSGIKTVTALCGEAKEITRYEKALGKGAEAARKKDMLVGFGLGGMYLLIYCFYAIALWYAVNMLMQGSITPGEIFTVFFSITICAFALGSLLPFINSIATSLGSMEILGTVLDSLPKIDAYSTTGDHPSKFTGRIKFNNVTFAYPGSEDIPVFKNLTLEIHGGQTVAIVGPGSSGKSTLINLLLRFYDPQKGQVKFDANDLQNLNVRWVREQIAVVEQNALLPPLGTIFDIIRAGRTELRLPHVIKAAKYVLIHDFIMTLPKGYMTPIIVPGGKEFSIGQRQCMLIARSILLNPKILILDEAMTAIEVPVAQQIEKNLANLRKNSTTIVIAHKLAIAQHADFIFVLKDGKVAEKGSHQVLVDLQGVYYEMLQHEDPVDSILAENKPESEAHPAETEAERELIEEHMQHSVGGKGAGLRLVDEEFDGGKDEKIELPSIYKILRVLPRKIVPLFFGFLGCLLSGMVIPVLAFCLGRILQIFLGSKEDLVSSGIFWVEVLVILAIAAGVGYCLQTIFISFVGEQLTVRLRILSYEAIIRQPISWFDHEANSPDFLYSRLASDIPFIKNAVGPRLGNAISSLITMITGFIIATIYGWQLALITMLTIPVLLLGLYIQRRTQHKAYKTMSEIRKNIIKWTNRSIKNIWIIQASSKALRICQRMESIIFKGLVEGQKQALSYGIGYSFSECLTFLTFGAAFRFGAVLIRERTLPIPDLFTIFFVITFGSLSLGQAKSFAPDYFKARLSACFIFKLIEMKSSVDPMSTTGLKPIIEGEIELRNVVFSYPILPNVKILQGTNLKIPKGSIIGIVGPVGGGKSTILSILERFYEIDSGEVLIDGINMKDINLRHLRQNIGYVAQEPNLFDLSIKENILYGYYGPVKAEEDLKLLVERAAVAADADFITEKLPQRFETKCGEHGKNLNTGQRQEVALARAVVKEPAIMLLDDPTSSLDAEEEQLVQRAMAKAMPGKTCIVVSNSYSSIKNCEYIAVLVDGKIAEFGKQTELLKAKGVYYNFVREQGVKIFDDIDESPSNVPPVPTPTPSRLPIIPSETVDFSDSDSD